MFTLELDDREHEALVEVLMTFLSELRTEVGHTDRRAYRQRLRSQEQTIKQILGRLESSHVV